MLSASQFAESRLVMLQSVFYEILVAQMFLSPFHLSFCPIFAPSPKIPGRVQNYTHTLHPAVHYRHYLLPQGCLVHTKLCDRLPALLAGLKLHTDSLSSSFTVIWDMEHQYGVHLLMFSEGISPIWQMSSVLFALPNGVTGDKNVP